MHIVHIASELAPVAKVGGLGDVLLGLSRELSWKGHDVDIIIPKYDCMDSSQVRDFAVDTQDLKSYYDGEWYSNTVWIGWVENLKVYFIEPHHPKYFFNRGCFYGCDDDIERYLYFSRAALDFLVKENSNPDIIHIHDWQTAVIAPLFYTLFKPQDLLTKPKIVMTIHNMEYQGKCASFNLDWIGMAGKKMALPETMQDPLYPQAVNLLKGSLVYSDFITTVSPNYAWEVKTPEGGRGLDPLIIKYQNKFAGVLNGIDYTYWNPEIDKYLPSHFSPRELPANKQDRNTLDKKAFIKKLLRNRLYLDETHKPLVGCIARLVPQKGIEMIKHVINTISDKKGQFVLLGSSPIPAIQQEFHELRHRYDDHPNVHLVLQHQEELAHWIFAGSDIFIVPSLFEPCGLTQLISMKYGTVPVVRKTGGLADTVFDVDYSGLPLEETNGYSFDFPDNKGIDSALDRALNCWYHDPDRWRKLMISAMTMDFSWSKPCNEYLNIYKKLLG